MRSRWRGTPVEFDILNLRVEKDDFLRARESRPFSFG